MTNKMLTKSLKIFMLMFSCIFSLLFLTACGEKPIASEFIKTNDTEIKYVNHEKGFSFIMPANWEYKENADLNQISFLAPKENDQDAFQENFYAGSGTSRSPKYKNATADEIYQMLLEKAQKGEDDDLKGFTLQNYEYVTIADEKALKLTYTGTSDSAPGLEIKFTQWYLSKGATNYMCQYTAESKSYDQYLPVIDKAIATFTYTPEES